MGKIILICLLLLPQATIARRAREFSYPSAYGIPKEKLFPQLYSIVLTRYSENEEKGMPTIIGWSGRTGAGQTTTALEFKRYLYELGVQSVTVLSCDDFLIPEKERVELKSVEFPSPGKEVRVNELRLRIRGIDENTIALKLPSSDWIELKLDKIGERKKVIDKESGNFLDLEIERQRDNTLVIHIPTFISKLDPLFYKTIMDLKRGKTVLIPQFDQVSRERLHLNGEELENYEKNGSTVEIDGKIYFLLEQKGLVADAKTGEIYKMIEPKGVIIVEGVWAMLRPEVNELYDVKVFVNASEEIRARRFGARHILEGRYQGQILFDIVKRGRIDWWKEQGEFEERQLKIADYILDNDAPISEIEMLTKYGTEEERIYKAIAVYKEDIKESRKSEKIEPWELLEYAWYVLTDESALSEVIKYIAEGVKKGGFTEIGLRRMLSSKEGIFGKLDDLQRSLLEDLLIEAGLLKRTEVKISSSWLKSEDLEMLNEALPKELIPYHLLLMDRRYSVLENWGFKEFTKGDLSSVEEINKVSNLFITALYNLYAYQTLNRYLKIPSNPNILSLGCGDFLKEIFMGFYFEPSILYGIDLDENKVEEARDNINKWRMTEKVETNIVVGDMRNLNNISILSGKKFDLIFMRIPVGIEMEDLEEAIKSAEGFLNSDGYLILYIKYPQLKLTIPQKLIAIAEEENLFSFNTYPLSGPISPEEKDKFIILSKAEVSLLREKLTKH